VVNKNTKDFLKDLGVISGGAVAGMLADWGVSMGWTAAGFPVVGVGTLKVDDILLLAAEGGGAYYMHTKNKKDFRNFLLAMFGMTVAIEVGELIMSTIPITAAYVKTPQLQVSKYIVA